jgi:uncharacterized OB-fold protein
LWKAAAEGRLLLPYCAACARHRWPARARCPQCRGMLEWRHAPGSGRIAALSIVRRAAQPELAQEVPYAVGFVELDAGVRMFAHIAATDPASLRPGMRVVCRFESTLDPALSVPVFVCEER